MFSCIFHLFILLAMFTNLLQYGAFHNPSTPLHLGVSILIPFSFISFSAQYIYLPTFNVTTTFKIYFLQYNVLCLVIYNFSLDMNNELVNILQILKEIYT